MTKMKKQTLKERVSLLEAGVIAAEKLAKNGEHEKAHQELKNTILDAHVAKWTENEMAQWVINASPKHIIAAFKAMWNRQTAEEKTTGAPKIRNKIGFSGYRKDGRWAGDAVHAKNYYDMLLTKGIHPSKTQLNHIRSMLGKYSRQLRDMANIKYHKDMEK